MEGKVQALLLNDEFLFVSVLWRNVHNENVSLNQNVNLRITFYVMFEAKIKIAEI
jgi:hypothetical protein